jgi:phosphoribosylformylglycinamidine cyclo-ligase
VKPRAPTRAGEAAYARAGVDLSEAARSVERIRALAAGASRPEVVEGVGGFAGLVRLGEGRLLAAAADGVGTKLEVARVSAKLDTIGIDLVAMCANDVVCTGAEPLFFLDYLATARIVPDEVEAIVEGVAEGCRRAGCALLGGETAEHPGVMDEGRFDLAGFCVGVIEESALLGPARVRPDDVVVGLRSSGLHSNGYSLVRRALLEDGRSLDEFVPELGRTLAEELLEPTAIYVRPMLALHRAGLVRSAAHITGGGLLGNVPRALPQNLGVVVHKDAWDAPPVFSLVAEAASIDVSTLFGVLNMGIGMVAVVPRASQDEACAEARRAGGDPVLLGRVTEEPGIRIE